LIKAWLARVKALASIVPEDRIKASAGIGSEAGIKALAGIDPEARVEVLTATDATCQASMLLHGEAEHKNKPRYWKVCRMDANNYSGIATTLIELAKNIMEEIATAPVSIQSLVFPRWQAHPPTHPPQCSKNNQGKAVLSQWIRTVYQNSLWLLWSEGLVYHHWLTMKSNRFNSKQERKSLRALQTYLCGRN